MNLLLGRDTRSHFIIRTVTVLLIWFSAEARGNYEDSSAVQPTETTIPRNTENIKLYARQASTGQSVFLGRGLPAISPPNSPSLALEGIGRVPARHTGKLPKQRPPTHRVMK